MKKILVAYFSASGETAKLAKTIAGVVDGDLFEISDEQNSWKEQPTNRQMGIERV